MNQEEIWITSRNVLITLLVMLAICLFVSSGGDGNDIEAHAHWMAEVKEQGAWVMW